jgi:hypothetical protein
MPLLLTLAALVIAGQTLVGGPVSPIATWDIATNGANTSYSQGLTHRYVDGELHFLSLTIERRLQEWVLPAAGTTQTSVVASWDLASTGAFGDFNGIWFEEAKQRLWVTSAIDYTDNPADARVTIISLGARGSFEVLKQFSLDVTSKRVYGGCQAVPEDLVKRLGGPYVCGWGGYTSLLFNTGGPSIGATMYAIPDPDTIQSGKTAKARTILDFAGTRGLRATRPINKYDDYHSPTRDGFGYMVWGDSYYNTGVWVGTTFMAIASLCKGTCWYADSTLHSTDRQFELHQWDGASLGSNRTKRADRMVELIVPRGNSWVSEGNTTATNIAGATYDATTGTLYAIGYTFGPDGSVGRLLAYRVSDVTAQPAQATAPMPAPR